MAIRSKDELLNTLKAVLGDSIEDTGISLLEDISDTIGDYDNRLAESGDWKGKYEENDANWRKKYKERFFEGSTPPPPAPDGINAGDYASNGYESNGDSAARMGDEIEASQIHLDDLFKKKGA